MPVATAEFVAGMRRLAAGVSIVTARWQGVRAGLTATSICSLSAEPPRLLACVHREADAHAVITGSGSFAVNLLTVAHQALADHFGGRSGAFGPERFTQGTWLDGATGAPLLADAAVSFDCRLAEALAAGTHSIFIGEIETVRLGSDLTPLVYEDRAYRRLVPLEG